MKRLFATFVVLLAIAASVSACAVYEVPPPAYGYAPGYYAHPYYHDEYRHHHW